MKLKLSLDPNALKQFFVDHVEKVLFGLVAACFLVFVYRAIARDTLPWQPQDLKEEASKAERNVANTKPIPPTIVEYKRIAEDIRKPIQETDYAFKTAWDPMKFRENRRRGLPTLYPIKDLRVSAGNGSFLAAPDEEAEADATAGVMPAPTPEGHRWVVVTGLIQHRLQKQAFDEAYQDAAQWDPERDYPQYVGYKVIRYEVDPHNPDGTPIAQKSFTDKELADMFVKAERWGREADLVDDWYLAPVVGTWEMAFPLGQLQNRAWGPDVVHPALPLRETMPGVAGGVEGTMPGGYAGMRPRRPAGRTTTERGEVAVASEAEEGKAPDQTAKPAEKAKKKSRKKPADQSSTDPYGLDLAAGGMDGMGGTGATAAAMPYGASKKSLPRTTGTASTRMMPPGGTRTGATPYGPMAYGTKASARSATGMVSPAMTAGRSSAMAPGMRGMGRRPYAAGDEEEEPEELEPEYYLFRFFDFTAQPGKHYRYRVGLVLANPNYGVPPHFLEKPGLEQERVLKSEWSDQAEPPPLWSKLSPVASVPLDTQVLAVSGRGSHGAATVMLVRFDEKQQGLLAAQEFNVTRGQLLNYLKQEYTGVTMATPTATALGGAPEAATAEKVEVDYVSETLLADVAGGATLPGSGRERLVEPASLLLVDFEGNLVVRNELDDLPEYRFHKPPEEAERGYPGPMAGTAPETGGAYIPGEKAKTPKGKAPAGGMGVDAYRMYMGMGAKAPAGVSAKPPAGGAAGAPTGPPAGYTPGMMMGIGDLTDTKSKKGTKKKK